jgi:hypothetical protein
MRVQQTRFCYNRDCMSEVTALSQDEAEEVLRGLPLVPATGGSLADMKTLRDRCLAAGIPALVGCHASPGGQKG